MKIKCEYCGKDYSPRTDSVCCGNKDCQKQYKKQYQKSDKYKQYQKQYHKSDKYKQYQKQYQKSDKYKQYLKQYQKSDKYKQYQKQYKKQYQKFISKLIKDYREEENKNEN